MLRLESWRGRLNWLLPAGVIFGLVAPILVTDRSFSTDWGNHLWLIWVQGSNIADLGQPSYFLQSGLGGNRGYFLQTGLAGQPDYFLRGLGVFYPYFAFYGGTFYAVAGAVSWLFGAEAAVVAAYAGALAACYLGWTWIARQLGIVGWRAQLPGCIAVTAPLAVTNLYGRGDIPEVVATSVIPLLAAAGLSLFRSESLRLPTAAIYVVSVVILTGTHTLTLVWGTVFLTLAAILLLGCYWREARQRVRRGIALAGLTALGIGINAWILAPLFLLHTRLVERDPDPIGFTAYTEPEQLFSLFRNTPDSPLVTADINAQLPVLALLWALVCGAVYWRFLPAAAKGVAIGLLALGGALLLLVLSPSLIAALPEVLQFIQFPYRIVTFVDICLVGLVTLALAAMQRDPSPATRIPVFALAAIAAFAFGLSMQQNTEVRSWLKNREKVLSSPVKLSPTWYSTLQFADGSTEVVEPTLAPLKLPAESIEERYMAFYPPGPAGTAMTNILTGEYLVEVSGARPVGRTDEGRMVVRLPTSREPREVEVTAAWSPAMTAGRVLSAISLLAALGAVAFVLVRRWRPDGR